jgi:hypothetical protein
VFIQRFQDQKSLIMLAWLALLACLISTTIVHHHDGGIHAALPACQLCALETISSHNSFAPSAVNIATPALYSNEHRDAFVPRFLSYRCTLIDIRGSPSSPLLS